MKQLNSSAAVNRRSMIVLVTVLVVAMTMFMIWLASSGTADGTKRDYISQVDNLQVLSQQIARHANEASSGDAKAFDQLADTSGQFADIFDRLLKGADGKSAPVAVHRVSEEIAQVEAVWNKVAPDATVMADSKAQILDLNQRGEQVAVALNSLQEVYITGKQSLLINAAPASQVAMVTNQAWLTERALRNVQQLLDGKSAEAVATVLANNINELITVHNGMRVGDAKAGIVRIPYRAVAGALTSSQPQVQILQDNLEAIVAAANARAQVTTSAAALVTNTGELLDATASLSGGFDLLLKEQLYARLGIAMIILVIVAFVVFRRIDKRLKRQSEANAQNQEAILRLLDELADLADGDLTVSATVTEDFTGAIADSINYAIDQLRSLVVSINETSVHVSQSADETRSTAIALSDASTKQAVAITDATDSINDIVSSMDDVANNADESSKVASSSVEIANKGAGAVQNTINGMDKIREQIQKTSKQIKRLGESSQEIGDIISLINDIADQTNILSLNAAIQASMAGDAGRGFAVVADEVQRLAERSGAATRQIEVLVKAIQADTNEAVISMEQTTAEVVQGARLAQDAGVALEEIEEVSNNLAQLIQEISGAAGEQSRAAVDIASTMGLIKEISTQTSTGSQETAGSIGNLADLAKEMRNSVSGFTLPGEEITSTSIEDRQPETAEEVLAVVSDEVEVVIESGEEKIKQDAGSAASAA